MSDLSYFKNNTSKPVNSVDSSTNQMTMTGALYTYPKGQVTTDHTTQMYNQHANRTYVFETMVIVIGVIGLLANAVVLYAIVTSKWGKNRAFIELVANQTALDLFSCIWLVVSYSLIVTNTIGYWSCMLFRNENLLWWGLYASKVNLISISIERYVMIVHPIWHRNNAKPWMIRAAVGVSWFTGFATSMSLSFATTAYTVTVCQVRAIWLSSLAESVFGIATFIIFFFVVLCSFLFCYGNILAVIRRQAGTAAVMPANNQPVTAKAMKEARMQRNTIKTMIIISVVFVICWLPCDLYLTLIYVSSSNVRFVFKIYQLFVFIAFCNVCMNPFIYATKYDVVKTKLIGFVKTGNSMSET